MMIVFASAGISLFAKGNWGADRTKNYAFETGHTGNVTGIIADSNGKAFFSCGKDGSVIKWSENGDCEKCQVSSYEITGIAKNPAGTDFVVAETDGNDINAITVFDWETLTKKFSKRFSEKITGIAYSQKGNTSLSLHRVLAATISLTQRQALSLSRLATFQAQFLLQRLVHRKRAPYSIFLQVSSFTTTW